MMSSTSIDARRRAHEDLKRSGALRDLNLDAHRFSPRPRGFLAGVESPGMPWAAWIEVDGVAHAIHYGATRVDARRALLDAVAVEIPECRQSKTHDGKTRLYAYVGEVVKIIRPVVQQGEWPKGYGAKDVLFDLGATAKRMRHDLRSIVNKGGIPADQFIDALTQDVAARLASTSGDERFLGFGLQTLLPFLDVLGGLDGPSFREAARRAMTPEIHRVGIGKAFPAIKAAWEGMGWTVADSSNAPFVKVTNAALRHAGASAVDIRSYVRARSGRR